LLAYTPASGPLIGRLSPDCAAMRGAAVRGVQIATTPRVLSIAKTFCVRTSDLRLLPAIQARRNALPAVLTPIAVRI